MTDPETDQPWDARALSRSPLHDVWDATRAELVALLLRRTAPDKADILRVKSLVRELERERPRAGPWPVSVDAFLSSYSDLHLGRVTGDVAIEKAALRRCLDCLGVGRPAR